MLEKYKPGISCAALEMQGLLAGFFHLLFISSISTASNLRNSSVK